MITWNETRLKRAKKRKAKKIRTELIRSLNKVYNYKFMALYGGIIEFNPPPLMYTPVH